MKEKRGIADKCAGIDYDSRIIIGHDSAIFFPN